MADASSFPSEITDLGASALSRAIAARTVSCVEVMSAYLDRIGRYNDRFNAVISMVDGDALLAEAAVADDKLTAGNPNGWMHGIPVAVKDLADAKDLRTTKGSRILEGTVAEEDSLFVKRMRDDGAIFIGKTNVPEFGLGSQTYNHVFGPTRNAYDPSLTAGGSSGGAAVGLATRMLPIADGSDMMGSLRNPAGWNNVIGFRPSQGLVPSLPSSDLFYQQLGTAGPMGRSVEDVARLLLTMAAHDQRDPLSRRSAIPKYEALAPVDSGDVKIAWFADYGGYLPTESGVLDVCRTALGSVEGGGGVVDEITPSFDMERLWECWLALRQWSVLWVKEFYDDPERRELLKPEVVWEYERGRSVSGRQLFDAGITRSEWYLELDRHFETYDVLALPTAQVFAFPVETHWPESIAGRTMDTYHRWMEVSISATLAGLPTVALPAGFDEHGRAMGIQFIGRMGADAELLAFAMAYEGVTGFSSTRPKLAACSR